MAAKALISLIIGVAVIETDSSAYLSDETPFTFEKKPEITI